MALDRNEAELLASVRGEQAVLVYIDGTPHWLLSALPCSLDELASSLGTDSWEIYTNGGFVVSDKNGIDIKDMDVESNWKQREPIFFHKRSNATPDTKSLKRESENNAVDVPGSTRNQGWHEDFGDSPAVEERM